MSLTIRAACNTGVLSTALLLAGCGQTASITTPVRPAAVIGSIIPSSTYELDAFDIQGNYAYILADNGNQGSGASAAQFYVVNITNPTSMSVVSTTPIIGSEFYGQSGIRAQGNYVYLESSTGTASTNLLQIYNVSNPSSPTFVGSVQIPLYSLGLWVSSKYAYAISYVGDTAASTLDIIDISNPASPVVVGSTTTGTPGLHVSDIQVVGNYAYVAGQSGSPSSGELVFDVSNPAAPFLVSNLWAEHSPQGLDIVGNLWYQSIYDGNVLNIYDITHPASLVQLGSASLAATCKPSDVTVIATTAYVACYEGSSVAMVNVSNPASPSVTGYIALPATSYPLFLESKGQYVYSISNSQGGALSVIDTGS